MISCIFNSSFFKNETLTIQVVQDLVIGVRNVGVCRYDTFGVFRLFVRVVNACHSLQLTGKRFGIQPLAVPLFALFQVRIHKNVNKCALGRNKVPEVLPSICIGSYCNAYRKASMSRNFTCNVSNSANIKISVFSRESQLVAEMLSNAVTI